MHISLENSFQDFTRGNIVAFEVYFNWYKKPLIYFSKMLLKYHDQVAEEIVLDTFVKCWEKRESFESPDKVQAFLYIVVKNSSLTFINSAYNKKYNSVEEYDENALIEEPEIFANLVRSDVMNILENEIEKLTSLQKQIIKMSYIEDYKPTEIADRLQMNPNAVYANYSRAVKSLRKGMMKKKDWLFSFFL